MVYIKDYKGNPLYWVISETEFLFHGVNYKKDGNGRCYRLEASTCLRNDCDRKLVKRRIPLSEFDALLELCKEIIIERLVR